MPEFFLTGRVAGGRETISISAPSSAAALAEAAARGYSDVVLHTDDAAAVATITMPPVDQSCVSAAEQVQLRALTNTGFFLFMLKKLALSAKWVLIIAFLLVAYRVARGAAMGFAGWVSMAVLLSPVCIAAWTAYFSKARLYEDMLEAFAWGRWNDVLGRIPALRGHVPEFELDVRSGCALAGLGRLEEGLSLVRTHEGADGVPAWMYFSRIAELYEVAHRYGDALDCHRSAYEQAPDNPTVALDLAMALHKNQADPELANRLIAEAEAGPVSDILVMVLPYVKGLAALNGGDYRGAEARFEECEHALRGLAPGSAMVRLILDHVRAGRAIALKYQGETQRAEALFATVLPRLEAFKDTRTIERFGTSGHFNA